MSEWRAPRSSTSGDWSCTRVVFAVAGTAYVAAFMTVASFIEVVGGDVPSVSGLAIVGLLVAATFHPMQVVLRGVVDELLFGHRPDPLDAAAGVVGSIGDDPVLALRAIREALVLPYAALRLDDNTVAESGAEVTHTRTIALAVDNESAGSLEVGLRPGDLTLSAGDEHVCGWSVRCSPRPSAPTGSPPTSRSPARRP